MKQLYIFIIIGLLSATYVLAQIEIPFETPIEQPIIETQLTKADVERMPKEERLSRIQETYTDNEKIILNLQKINETLLQILAK